MLFNIWIFSTQYGSLHSYIISPFDENKLTFSSLKLLFLKFHNKIHIEITLHDINCKYYFTLITCTCFAGRVAVTRPRSLHPGSCWRLADQSHDWCPALLRHCPAPSNGEHGHCSHTHSCQGHPPLRLYSASCLC